LLFWAKVSAILILNLQSYLTLSHSSPFQAALVRVRVGLRAGTQFQVKSEGVPACVRVRVVKVGRFELVSKANCSLKVCKIDAFNFLV